MTSTFLAFAILGSVWRMWDGSDLAHIVPGVFRGVICLILCIACFTFAKFELPYQWTLYDCARVTICSIGATSILYLGYTRWDKWVHSILRYGVTGTTVALIYYVLDVIENGIIVASIAGPVIYSTMSFLVAVSYVLLHTVWKDFDYSTRTAECIAGSVIVGGLAHLANPAPF